MSGTLPCLNCTQPSVEQHEEPADGIEKERNTDQRRARLTTFLLQGKKAEELEIMIEGLGYDKSSTLSFDQTYLQVRFLRSLSSFTC